MIIPMPQNKDVVYFGRTDFRGADRLFGIRRSDRRQHTYIVGKTGTGKTTLIRNMIIQDISNGEGLCVVDPHGELAESLLREIPAERLKDVIYFNPADIDFHMGFNVLELPDLKYKHLIASGLMSIFTKIWSNVWSARMEYILNNAILALLETPGSTMLGITRILVDKTYRQKVIGNVTDPVVKAFWIHEYEEWQDRFRNEAIAPIQNKVGQFLSTALIRNIVGQAKSTIDIFDIMNTRKIFIVNVSKGRIGEDNSALLGAMLITKIQLSAMERVRIPEEERTDFYLYVDEFQNFATDSFAGILSEARKYRLNLIIAHQYIGQLVTDVSTKVRDAVFGNVGTMMAFRVGAADAEFLEKEFEPEFVPQDIINLPNFHVYLKLTVNGVMSRPFSARGLSPFHLKTGSDTPEKVVEISHKLYGRPRQVVEDEINRWSGMTSGPEEREGAGRGGFPPRREGFQGPGGGERPLPPRRIAPSWKEAEQSSQLAALGIEFQPGGQKAPPQREFVPRERRPYPPQPYPPRPYSPRGPGEADPRRRFLNVPPRPYPTQNRLSPSQVVPPVPKVKTGPDILGLRDALKEAIGEVPKKEEKKPSQGGSAS